MRVRGALLLVMVGLVLGGCAARAGRSALAPDAVSYDFQLQPGTHASVRVTLRARGEENGSSRLAVAPNWGGVQDCKRFIHGLVVRDAAGRELPFSEDPGAPHTWTVSHQPGVELVARYELRPSERDPLSGFGAHYEPVVRDDLLHLIGETGLVYPAWLEDRGPIRIAMSWSGFRERGWSVVTSFDGERGHIRRPMHEFRHAMFLAGRVRVHDRRIGDARLRVAVYGDDWGFGDPELVDLVERIVTIEREFMRDFDDPYFLVTAVPTGPRATPRSVSLGGTGLTNCFALFLPPGISVAEGSPHRAPFLRLLAHEYFHTWIGGEIRTEEPEELVYWFSEGFTDFYASRLLRRAGLISDADWTERLNETIRKLWRSPAATEPGETIRKDFWTRREIQELPYHRGELVALMLDEEIRRVSGGVRSLDDFLLEVLVDARAGEKAETGRLLSRIARWTSPEFSETVRRIVVDGGLPEVPESVSDPAAERVEVQAHRYDPGFDVDASLQAKAAKGVREGGPAHAAGLREGQEITGFSVHRGDPDRAIELKIRANGVEQGLRFLPRGEALTIPEYVLDSGRER